MTRTREDASGEADAAADLDPGADLIALLKAEVGLWRARLVTRHGGARPMKAAWGARVCPAAGELAREDDFFRCPLCPFRAFQRAWRVADHLRRTHTAAVRFCPSGRKQLRAAVALYDQDMVNGGGRRVELSATKRGPPGGHRPPAFGPGDDTGGPRDPPPPERGGRVLREQEGRPAREVPPRRLLLRRARLRRDGPPRRRCGVGQERPA